MKSSTKGARFQREFLRMRKIVEGRSGGLCEAPNFVTRAISQDDRALTEAAYSWQFENACNGRASHVHHRKYRSRGGTNSPANLVHVCSSCHDWIHAHGEKSNLLGLSLRAEENE